MTLLQALQGKLGPTAAEPALLQEVIQNLGNTTMGHKKVG